MRGLEGLKETEALKRVLSGCKKDEGREMGWRDRKRWKCLKGHAMGEGL